MSGAPEAAVGVDIGLRPRSQTPVTLSASRTECCAYLVIGDDVAEIVLERTHLVSLLDQAGVCVAELDRADADAATQEQTEVRVGTAADIKQQLVRLAQTAENSAKSEKLRRAIQRVDEAIAAADHARDALDDANATLDRASDHARSLVRQAIVAEDIADDT